MGIVSLYIKKKYKSRKTGSRTSQNLLSITLIIKAMYQGKLNLFMYTINLSLVICLKNSRYSWRLMLCVYEFHLIGFLYSRSLLTINPKFFPYICFFFLSIKSSILNQKRVKLPKSTPEVYKKKEKETKKKDKEMPTVKASQKIPARP